jgi:tetratricopeptide (TPR) repeat protein/TolB-like protein
MHDSGVEMGGSAAVRGDRGPRRIWCRRQRPRMCLMTWVLVCLSGATTELAQTPPAVASRPEPWWLVVPFESVNRDPRGYWLGEGSAVMLTDTLMMAGARAISRDDRIRAFERLRVPAVASLSHATVIRLGQVVGATYVVVGTFELHDDALTVRARAIQLETGRMTPEIVETGLFDATTDLYARVAQQLVPEGEIDLERLEERTPPPTAFEQYIKGVLAESPATRIAFLNQALRVSPGFQRVRLALWKAHTDLGEHQAALNVVRFVPPEHELARRAGFLAGVSLLHLGQYQQASDTFAALHQDVPDPALVNNLGIVQLRRPAGAPGGPASGYFHDAVALDDRDPDLLFNLGYALWREGQVEQAVETLREAVRRSPADDAAHYVLGVALAAKGLTQEASREKDLARRLSSEYAEWEAKRPTDNAAPDGLERVKGDFEVPASLRAEQVVVAAGARDQQELAAIHLDTGRRLIQAERDDEAIGELRRAVYLSPYLSEAHLLLGRAYLRLGRVQDAVDALKISIWSDDTIAARLALAEAYLQARDIGAARAELEVVASRDPDHADVPRLLGTLPDGQ